MAHPPVSIMRMIGPVASRSEDYSLVLLNIKYPICASTSFRQTQRRRPDVKKGTDGARPRYLDVTANASLSAFLLGIENQAFFIVLSHPILVGHCSILPFCLMHGNGVFRVPALQALRGMHISPSPAS